MPAIDSRLLELSERLDTIERKSEPPLENLAPFDYPRRNLPMAQRVQVLATKQDVGVTHVTASFEKPPDPNIERFEIWANNIGEDNEEPVKIIEVRRAPVTFQLSADSDVTSVCWVRTVMDDNSISSLDSSPTFTVEVTQQPVGTDGIADGAVTTVKIADLAVTTAKIDNLAVTNAKIGFAAVDTAQIATAAIETALIADAAIVQAKIANLAVGTAQIADAAITTAKIGAAQITTALIENAAITNALIANLAVDTAQIQNLAITDAKINDLSASKLTAGTIDAGVISVINLNASNINTGTLTAIAIALTSGNDTLNLLTSAQLEMFNTTLNERVLISTGKIELMRRSDSFKGVRLRAFVSGNVQGQIEVFRDDAQTGIFEADAGGGKLTLKTNAGSSTIVAAGSTGNINITGDYQIVGVDVINSSRQLVNTRRGEFDTSGGVVSVLVQPDNFNNALAIQNPSTGAERLVHGVESVAADGISQWKDSSGNVRTVIRARGDSQDQILIKNSTGTNRILLGTITSGADSAMSFTSSNVQVDIRTGTSGLVGVYIGGNRVLAERQTDPGASPTTDELRNVLLAHGLI